MNDTVVNATKQAARFPSSNFTDVIPKELKKCNYEALLIQAGSVDITNLNTAKDASEHLEYFKQETVVSAKNIFSAGVKALDLQPSLKKVIIMKQIPRYDSSEDDPMGLKAALSQLFNNTLTECWMECAVKEKLFIGNHNIDCTGSIRESRYRETKSGKWDGIHLFGASGQKFYTLSVLNVLKAANMTSSDYNFHQSCPQFQNQSRQRRSNNQRTGRQTSSTQTQTSTGSQARGSPHTGNPVPTFSRFNVLTGLSQGN